MSTFLGTPVNQSAAVGNIGTAITRVDIKDLNGNKTFARRIEIQCTHASQDLLVSFDGDPNFISVLHGAGVRVFEGYFNFIAVKASGAGTTWECLAYVSRVS